MKTPLSKEVSTSLFVIYLLSILLFFHSSGWIGGRAWRIGGCWVGGATSSTCHYSSCSTCACPSWEATCSPCSAEAHWGGRWIGCFASWDGTLSRSFSATMLFNTVGYLCVYFSSFVLQLLTAIGWLVHATFCYSNLKLVSWITFTRKTWKSYFRLFPL